MGSEGSDARIGKTKIKKNTVSQRKVRLYCNIFTGIILKYTVIGVYSATVSM